jgi:hypothetical protein
MSRMISRSRCSEWVNVHESRLAFCCISSALAATPPALAAFPGANRTPEAINARIASGHEEGAREMRAGGSHLSDTGFWVLGTMGDPGNGE